jgi:hypothetical protein
MKSHKEVTKQKESRFFLLFLLDDGRSRSVLLTNGSGSGRPKNIRIRIRNTGLKVTRKNVVQRSFVLDG